MSDKRRGLGRGLGALIPSSAAANASGNGAAPSRPVDLFFPRPGKRLSPTMLPCAEDRVPTGTKQDAAAPQLFSLKHRHR